MVSHSCLWADSTPKRHWETWIGLHEERKKERERGRENERDRTRCSVEKKEGVGMVETGAKGEYNQNKLWEIFKKTREKMIRTLSFGVVVQDSNQRTDNV